MECSDADVVLRSLGGDITPEVGPEFLFIDGYFQLQNVPLLLFYLLVLLLQCLLLPTVLLHHLGGQVIVGVSGHVLVELLLEEGGYFGVMAEKVLLEGPGDAVHLMGEDAVLGGELFQNTDGSGYLLALGQ